jgi:hypothetical protein
VTIAPPQCSADSPTLVEIVTQHYVSFSDEFDIISPTCPVKVPPTSAEIRQSRRKQVEAALTKVLGLRNLALSQCGIKKFVLPEWDDEVGFWKEPGQVTPKAPRWVVRLDRSADSSVVAQPPFGRDRSPHPGTDRIGYANTTRGNIAALAVRVIAAIGNENQGAHLLPEWEWILIFIFGHGLAVGSSGQLFEKFEPASGRLQYLNAPLSYVAAFLVGLNDFDEEHPDLYGRSVTYEEATHAIQRLIHVDPTT